MYPAAKLAVFAAILALLFGGGALLGQAAGPFERSDAAAMEGHGAGAPKAVRGLAVSDDGLTLELDSGSAPRGKRFRLGFRITDADGTTVRDFDVEHTKRMHVIVVRRDMTGFQHLHPTQAPDGSWSVPATLPAAGSYRVFADFSAGDEAHTLADDVTVDGPLRSRDLPAPTRSAAVDGMRVTLDAGTPRAGEEAELGFSVTRDGRPVEPEPYLGARGHLVALRQGDLAFLHVHPDEDRLSFMAELPTAGSYRLFLQFKVDGRVHTAAFTQEVSR